MCDTPVRDKKKKEQEYVSLSWIAERWGCSASLVRREVETGKLAGIKIGSRGVWRVKIQTLLDYENAPERLDNPRPVKPRAKKRSKR
jgi:biotin operon repressor